jgi:O-succinylbenzoic acid--CoA ligase
LLALPAEHVAGLQVLLRSLVTGTGPVVVDLAGGFRPERFASAARRLPPHGRRYTALVPTQLRRLLDAGGTAVAALATFDSVLLGGSAAPGPLLDRAAVAGVRIVATYGMSETCGGCVYDGRPLDGVEVSLDADGRVRLGGPVVARGYRGGDPTRAFTVDADGRRWFRTDDAGQLQGDPPPALTVLGRLDDLIVTGGLKVAPAAVEGALLSLPGIVETVVVGVPDPEWGQRVVAAVVPDPGAGPPTLDDVRRAVGTRLGPAAAPRQLLVLDVLPLRGPGKPDRAQVKALAHRPA